MQLTPAQYLIERFGGISAMARALGHTYPTTVQGWKERGVIPTRQLPAVLAAGAALEPKLSMREFFETREGEPHATPEPAQTPSEAAE